MIYLLIPVFIVGIIYFLFGRISKVDEIKSIPKNLASLLNEHVDYYQNLDANQKILFENYAKNFLSETRIEGIGLEINDLDRIYIAASAIIPIFGFSGWKYKNLRSIILYPETFNESFQFDGE